MRSLAKINSNAEALIVAQHHMKRFSVLINYLNFLPSSCVN